jgi:hypothetical protein
MTSASGLAPTFPLSQVLAALDRLPAAEGERQLAQTLARVCHEEARPVEATALLAAAKAQMAAAAPVAQETDLLDPGWNRPTSSASWQAALQREQHAKEAAERQRQRIGQRFRTIGWVGLLAGIAAIISFAGPFGLTLTLASVEMGCVLAMNRQSNQADACDQAAHRHQANLDKLLPITLGAHDKHAEGQLPSAYVAWHTATGVPLLNGDLAALRRLQKLASAHAQVNAWLATAP